MILFINNLTISVRIVNSLDYRISGWTYCGSYTWYLVEHMLL